MNDNFITSKLCESKVGAFITLRCWAYVLMGISP